MSALLLVEALRDPSSVTALDADGWTALIGAARAEQMIGTLAYRLHGLPMPDAAARILADARLSADQGRIAALWEAEMARRALAPLGVPVVLLKGTAFVAAGLSAGVGRSIGDLDILVPRDSIDAVEAALLRAGWEWVKPDPYDDAYYRKWMHELPPLIHRERDRMIDVHHTILPLTARVRPDAAGLIADSIEIGNGLSMLSREDVLVHAAAHLFADGDLAGGLRNLWDIHCLLDEFDAPGFRDALIARAAHHGLAREMARAVRLADALYSATPALGASGLGFADRLYRRRLLGRDGWGVQRRKLSEFAFYLRGHYLRMPPTMLARHLWTKWRKGYRPPG
ncbi:nucleotidyltransferase family protein [Sphingomonas sp. S1-29]|uniref:nucleotidyltransferase domain-containing protein n=1 Tax=Sphingomonas sp. S1-29 TaxID=2991074 RepID=UPI0022409FC2|nr:nucleotidyltransferase family protein [Sphingomonas sp. S1-29]UZK69476.1 nucleotidyltransferase family protein [Sphingomonas sp. S1-29]